MSETAIQKAMQIRRKRSRRRALLIVSVLTYVACFHWIYVHYLYPEFGYFGYDYNPPGAGYVLFAWALSAVPSLWMPMVLRRPSQLAYWILYITVFIPSMFVPLYAGLETPGQVAVFMAVLFAGFAVIGANYLFRPHRFRRPHLSARAFWIGVGAIGTILVVWMVIVFRNHLQIVSFSNVYDLRDTASDIEQGTNVNYTYMLLSGAIDPFLMGWGLYYKKKWLFLAGALGQLLVYAVMGSKSAVLSILFIYGFYVLFNKRRFAFAIKMMFVTLALSGTLCVSYYAAGENPSALELMALSVVFQRTLSSGGLVTAQYYDFFQRNPVTHLSNVKGFNLFMHYPYQYPIGQEIGLAYAGTTELDATANFWASDGIGAFGLVGILLVSGLCAAVFWALDSFASDRDPRFVGLLISFAALNLANVSIFTTLLSGGLGLLMVLIYFMPGERATSRGIVRRQAAA